MHPGNPGGFQGRSYPYLAAAFMLFAATAARAAPALSLEEAQAMALSQDPSVRAVESRKQAMQQQAVAGAQLPDPTLRMGLMSLPTDTFHLGQEPMTQVLVGVSQKFPRGQSRALRSEQMLEQSEALDETARDKRLGIALAVSESYLEVLKQLRLAEINASAINAFADLADITQDYYATGRAQQQDVLSAAVELARAEDRAERIAQEEERARARLSAWIGQAAYREFEADWPNWEPPAPLDRIKQDLATHPRIAALQQQFIAAETGIELAEQRYKPEFGVDLSYGGRGGIGPDGGSRPDLFSVMVMMDLPLFPEKRQDRYRAASIAESSAAQFERDDVFRRMSSEAELQAATLQRQQQRLRLFEERLLPEAGFNAEATYDAYRAALEDFTTLIRARITEFEVQLDYAALRAENLKTQARLRYLQGEVQ